WLLALEAHVRRGRFRRVHQENGEAADAQQKAVALLGAQGGVRVDGHVVERLFPLAGGGGGGDLLRGDGDQFAALLRGDDVLARTLGQPHLDEPLDGGGAGGGRAEAGGLHALAQFLV